MTGVGNFDEEEVGLFVVEAAEKSLFGGGGGEVGETTVEERLGQRGADGMVLEAEEMGGGEEELADAERDVEEESPFEKTRIISIL